MEQSKGFCFTCEYNKESILVEKQNIITGGSVWSIPVVWNDYLIIGDWDGRIKCYTLIDYSCIWEIQTRGSIYSKMNIIDDNYILICNDAGEMIKLNKNGIIIWKKDFGASLHSNVYISNNYVIATCYDHHVYKICIDDGSVILSRMFNEQVSEDIYSSPMVDDSTTSIIFGTNNELISIDYDTFETNWSFDTGNIIDATASLDDRNVYIGSENRRFYAVNKHTGEVVWETLLNDKINSSSILCENNIYIGDISGILYSIDKKNGDINWQSSNFGGFYYCQFSSINNRYITFVINENFYMVEMISGAVICKYDYNGLGFHSPPFIYKDTVIIGSHNKRVGIFKFSSD
ncbi:PQQ-binding-like beta-propeller repeat protein [Macrococcus armenti]|uniref:outer membrane protein assembly factor BamB family protein n=1 Tax=Macrococcus armenti TaxID=2875764 RepID=UPI001CCCF88B|nr:PQQ-binding-like beta-propeller repeat protein [Macrococcus armenti]UBH16593.1 PQQ-like beta-propeller repeat protein [Macrococcus armenti]UBH21228.1 PQQ-like beta-propeller repeat protein [Macrococcus armenti]